jgi:general secretion pathway protein C
MKFDTQYLLSPQYARWIIPILSAFFALLILVDWSRFFFFHPASVAEAVSEKKPLQNQQHSAKRGPLHTSLFGIYVTSNLDESKVKQSMLNVTLVGVLLADKIEDSQVIIRSANGQEKTYKVNDIIPGGAIIKRIVASGVLVEHNGALERLSLPRNKLNFEPIAKPLKEE